MSIPLLRTKLYIPPPQPGSVQRARLTGLINEGLARKLTVISAPAGFGKTTLLSEWIRTSQRQVTWLSLEEADNDPIRFWSYFIAALQMLQLNLGQDAQTFLHAEGQQFKLDRLEAFITLLLNDLSDFPDELALVLDDYQHINNQAIHEGLVFILDHLPPRMHILITCRADPPLPIARLRARGQLTELRAEDLRFSSDEVVLFLNQVMRLDLSVDQIAALEARTEGWIAGLQLAAISMQRRENMTAFIDSFTGSHRFILDYLVDEVLSCQSEDVQSFLLETSILKRFTSALCNTVTGKDDGQEMLERLEETNLFILPLDNERRWYRYHRLFADLLRSRLQELKPDLVQVLHQRACEWFDREGLLPEAIHHALTVNDYDRAALLVEKATETQRQVGEIATLMGWMNAIPHGVWRSHPALCLAYARALADTAQQKAVEEALGEAQAGLETYLRSTDPLTISLRGQMAALTAYLEITRQHFDQAIEMAEHARQLLAEDDTRWRSYVALNLAGAYRFTSNWAAADQTYLEASDLSRAAGDSVNALAALSMRGEVLEAQGQLNQSAQQFDQVLHLAQEFAIPNAPVTGYALVGLGRAWLEWNDLQASANYVQEGIQCGKRGDIKDILLRGYLVLGSIRKTQADLEGAQEALVNAELAAQYIGTVVVKDWVNAFRAQTWLEQGDIEAAVRWASKLSENINDRIFPTIAIALARVRLVQRRPEEALNILEHALESAQAVGRLGNAIQILVVKALVYQDRGDIVNALGALSRALILAEPEGYLRTFLDEGEPMRSLISDFQSSFGNRSREIVPGNPIKMLAYTQRLLNAFTVSSVAQSHTSISHRPHASISEPLTERELEILRLMAAGLSNRDIADLDVVSINTVKTQVKSIYGKLGSHNRADALTAAHELGLL